MQPGYTQVSDITAILHHIKQQLALGAADPLPTWIDLATPTSNQKDTVVNTVWFLCLAISLSTTFAAATTRRWLRNGDVPAQMKYIPIIINHFTVMLSLSMILFVIGLTYSLYGVHLEITIAITVIVVFTYITESASIFIVLSLP